MEGNGVPHGFYLFLLPAVRSPRYDMRGTPHTIPAFNSISSVNILRVMELGSVSQQKIET